MNSNKTKQKNMIYENNYDVWNWRKWVFEIQACEFVWQ